MASKYVYVLDDHVQTEKQQFPDLAADLLEHKMQIGKYYSNKKWDKFKKQTNSYELIFTSGHTLPSLSSYLPISRSFFKHWEILHDFKDEILTKDKMRIACLAEGPGGFIEAFVNFRQHGNDTIFGMTLISQDRCVPNWKLSNQMIEQNNITLLYGKDKTGSLYNDYNIFDTVEKIGQGTCDYITADGGFDFSNNFNNQEELSINLISKEIQCALLLQKKGGAFLLKIYDIHLKRTKELLYVLKQNYRVLNFIKPLTSRPANSEKYVLCLDFHGDPSQSTLPMDDFLLKLDEFNTIFICRQIININMSLMSIHYNHDYTETLKKQLKKGIKWLFKYNIPVTKDALSFYKMTLSEPRGKNI